MVGVVKVTARTVRSDTARFFARALPSQQLVVWDSGLSWLCEAYLCQKPHLQGDASFLLSAQGFLGERPQ